MNEKLFEFVKSKYADVIHDAVYTFRVSPFEVIAALFRVNDDVKKIVERSDT